MKVAGILHGMGGNPDSFWQPWLGRQLSAKGYEVVIPQMPHTDDPSLVTWLPAAQAVFDDVPDVLVGHSAGCPLILAMLEQFDRPVEQTILVAGFAQRLPKVPHKIVKDDYDWPRIRSNAGEVVMINSNDDPWGCDDKAGQFLLDHLGGSLIIRDGDGHMGSDSFDQPYLQFPLLARLID